MKRCCSCGVEKLESEFNKNRTKRKTVCRFNAEIVVRLRVKIILEGIRESILKFVLGLLSAPGIRTRKDLLIIYLFILVLIVEKRTLLF